MIDPSDRRMNLPRPRTTARFAPLLAALALLPALHHTAPARQSPTSITPAEFRARLDDIADLAKRHIVPLSQLDEVEARLTEMETQAQETEMALKRTLVRAPISCVLNKLKAKRGDFIRVADPVAQIIQLDRVKVKVGVPGSDVAAVCDLDQAEVLFEALRQRRVTGKKDFLSRQPDSLSRLYALQLSIPNPGGDILPGMFVRVELVKHIYTQALAVPIFSVITEKNGRSVYVVNQGKAERRNVTLGSLSSLLVHVTSGLQPGEEVIVIGQRQVNEGQSVVVMKNFSSAAAGGRQSARPRPPARAARLLVRLVRAVPANRAREGAAVAPDREPGAAPSP